MGAQVIRVLHATDDPFARAAGKFLVWNSKRLGKEGASLRLSCEKPQLRLALPGRELSRLRGGGPLGPLPQRWKNASLLDTGNQF